MKPSVFLQINPHEVAIGFGRLEKSAEPSSTTPSFYINDFLLTSEFPWRTPERFEVRSLELLRREMQKVPQVPVCWDEVSSTGFRKKFSQIQALIEEGALNKAVPALFETGQMEVDGPWLFRFFPLLVHATNRNSYLFGFEENDCGVAGLSPELLFEKKESTIVASALAGTQSADKDPANIKNKKDLREHQLVVEDLFEKLSFFGPVHKEETSAHHVGALIHLRTILSAKCDESITYEAITKKLHPTAALGVYPQTEKSRHFLVEDEYEIRRDLFGSPFGLQFPNGDGLSVIAIRSAQWKGSAVRVGSGCGVIKESSIEAELHELRMKRDIIKRVLFSAS